MTGRLLNDDRGYATVVSLGIILALVSLTGVILAAAGMVLATHRAQVAADLAAVAGAWAHAHGNNGCAAATHTAELNDAELNSCQIQGGDLLVEASVDGRVATAMAGPI